MDDSLYNSIDPAGGHRKITDLLNDLRKEEKKTRELSLAITKAEECLMWYDRHMILNKN